MTSGFGRRRRRGGSVRDDRTACARAGAVGPNVCRLRRTCCIRLAVAGGRRSSRRPFSCSRSRACVLAHAELETPTPADKSTVTEPVTEVSGVYSQAMKPDGSSVVVRPSGHQVAKGGVDPADDTRMVATPATPLGNGTYRVESDDTGDTTATWRTRSGTSRWPSPRAQPRPPARAPKPRPAPKPARHRRRRPHRHPPRSPPPPRPAPRATAPPPGAAAT